MRWPVGKTEGNHFIFKGSVSNTEYGQVIAIWIDPYPVESLSNIYLGENLSFKQLVESFFDQRKRENVLFRY